MNKNFNKAAFLGKTVKRIDTSNLNVVEFYFTDGTSVMLDTENTEIGIPCITTNDMDGYQEKPVNVRADQVS